MQINLEQVIEKYDSGYGLIVIHKFTDINLERINSFCNTYIMNFISKTNVRLYFELFKGYNVTITYDFIKDIFYCDLCDANCIVLKKINTINKIDKIIDKIEEVYLDTLKNRHYL